MSHEHRMEQLRAAMRLPGNLQKKLYIFCRGLDIRVSNIGSIYREQHGATALLEIVPPQIFAVAVGALQEKPGVYTDPNGIKQIGIRQVMPLCLAFDHRAVDFEALVPFMRTMDRLFAHPAIIHQW